MSFLLLFLLWSIAFILFRIGYLEQKYGYSFGEL